MGKAEPIVPPAETREPPQVFSRTFVVPPGMPWDQGRAAALEARHGSPLPIVDLLHRVRRLEPWSPAQPGRFAAFYVRRGDYEQPFDTTLMVDGAPVRIGFGTPAMRLPELGPWPLRFAVVAGLALLAAAPLALAWNARIEADARLSAMETRLAARDRQARRVEADRGRAIALAQSRAGLMRPADLLGDLGWVARAKASDARIVAVHWERGVMALEARGDAAPVAGLDRQVIAAPRPLRPGVRLWGVAPLPATGAPTVADLRER